MSFSKNHHYKIRYSKYQLHCHICKQQYLQLHHHYYSLCPQCAEFNFAQRHVKADLSSKISLVTGGRIKIGFEIAKKLLRCGSQVIVTTRFPEDALRRYEIEDDYDEWKHNLIIVYLDLINFNQVLQFANWVKRKFSRLDILILNAAQTISRENIFYANVLQDYNNSDHVIEFGSRSKLYEGPLEFNSLNYSEEGLKNNFLNGGFASIEGVPGMEVVENCSKVIQFELDEDHQMKEYRQFNTWSERLDNFNMKDFLAVLLINLFSPACLVQLLTPLLKREKVAVNTSPTPSPPEDENFSFVILVSAVEGMFKINTKSPNHPHTNAAKAGLNMFTRTSANDYKNRFNILLNSVDTGFITVETKNIDNFVPPLDNEDGMARVLHPIFEWVNKKRLVYGKMMKNFKEVDF